jgi:hypothetical protein
MFTARAEEGLQDNATPCVSLKRVFYSFHEELHGIISRHIHSLSLCLVVDVCDVICWQLLQLGMVVS